VLAGLGRAGFAGTMVKSDLLNKQRGKSLATLGR